jgi:hypothetical protein
LADGFGDLSTCANSLDFCSRCYFRSNSNIKAAAPVQTRAAPQALQMRVLRLTFSALSFSALKKKPGFTIAAIPVVNTQTAKTMFVRIPRLKMFYGVMLQE